MANTYTLISSNVLSATAASVTFSAIPSTYTDLVLRTSTRVDRAINGPHNCLVTVNGSSTSDYSYTNLISFGTTISTVNASAQNNALTYATGNSSTANTFSNNELYFPNYAGSLNKICSTTDVVENSTNTDFEYAYGVRAQLRSNTAAITSIKLNTNGYNYMIGSSFYLYGIKNS
jgi:hypothetical protein